MVERLTSNQDNLLTSEYAKRWTEKSQYSRLKDINTILNDDWIKKIKEIKTLRTKIANREYRDFQKTLWIPLNKCDWKLWWQTFEHVRNYVNKLRKQQKTTIWVSNRLRWLKNNVSWQWDTVIWKNWFFENLVDTTNIQRREAEHLKKYETLSEAEYKKLFSWKESLQQWQLGDCYLVSWIHELARAQHFDTLMRTSIKEFKQDNWETWYQIKIPLWEPSWRKILLKNSEIKVAKIKGNTWYKLLELAYAKNKLRKNDKQGNTYKPITDTELKKISWWWTKEVLQSFLWKENISFNDFWDPKKERPLAKLTDSQKLQMKGFLKNYVPSIWNKFVSLSSLKWASDQKSYSVWDKKIYYKHAYSLIWVNKNNKWEIQSIKVLNPWNKEWNWKNYQDFTLEEFFNSFTLMCCGKIKTNKFLDDK